MVALVDGNKIKWIKPGVQITGEKMPGDLDGWDTYLSSVNDAVFSTLGTLQNRSSTLYHTYAPVASAINKTVAYAIGSGNMFRSHPDRMILGLSQQEASEWGRRFQLYLHYYYRRLGWYEKQAVLFRGALIMGDSLLYFIRDGGVLDLIESGGDNIDYKKASTDYILGIKVDKYGRRKGIYTDKPVNFVNQKTGDQQVLQFMLKEYPRQVRGLPIAYKIISLAKNHDRHMDATIQRAVIESIMLGYSNTDSTNLQDQLTAQQAQLEAMKRKSEGGTKKSVLQRIGNAFKLGGGNFYRLKTGESMQFTDLKTPSNNFGMFQEWMIKFVAMATDTTPGVIMSNYPTSYSSHRGEFNDFFKMVLYKRNIFNKFVNDVVKKEVAKQMIFDGVISAPGFFDDPIKQEAWLAGSYLGPVPGHINPKQEVEAFKTAVDESFMLRSDVAALYGGEWENFIDEWETQERRYRAIPEEVQAETLQEDLKNA